MREHGVAFFVLENRKVLKIEFQKLRTGSSLCKTMSTPNKNGMDIGVKRLKMGLEIDVNLGVKGGGNAHQGGHLRLVGLVEDTREV